jgi:hypothetical protein
MRQNPFNGFSLWLGTGLSASAESFEDIGSRLLLQ